MDCAYSPLGLTLVYFKFGYLVGLSSKRLRSPNPSLIRVLRNPSSTRIRY